MCTDQTTVSTGFTDERFKQLIKNSFDMIVLLDSNGNQHYVSDSCERILGYKPEELTNISVIEQMIHPEDQAQVKAGLTDILEDSTYGGAQYRHRHKNGGWVYLEAFGTNQINNPLIKSVVLNVRDVTEIIKNKELILKSKQKLKLHLDHLEELVHTRTSELAQSRDAAEAANRAKSVFLTTMSHELRTPLNGLMGMTDLALSRATDPLQIDWLSKSQSSAKHLFNVLNDILNLAKIEADRLTLEENDFPLALTIDDSLQMQSAAAEAKGLRLSCEIDAALPGQLCGDALHLKQILLNYIGNAVKFSERGQIKVRARALEQDQHSVLLKLEVSDEGIGISPEQIRRLFQPFVQADDALTRKYGGSGLGLVIAKRIAKLMGGDAGVESTVGVGSTFWVTVRLRTQRAKAAKPQPIVTGEAKTAIRTRYFGQRILVVDDEPVSLEFAQLNLLAAELAVDTAVNGAEAVVLAKKTPYAAIFMDMQMPEINGLDATRQIRQLPGYEDTSIIAMTANAYDEDKALCIEAGMNDFLAKPFSPDELFGTLLSALNRSDD